ncbi:MAG: hypothetical protein PF689_08615, partial [Deltaproteobacteria bacterium]|nr:hypothetical protein [Deltaproteobacteria bacterium]
PYYEKYKLPPVKKGESIKKQFPLHPKKAGLATKNHYRLNSCLIKQRIKTDKATVILNIVIVPK